MDTFSHVVYSNDTTSEVEDTHWKNVVRLLTCSGLSAVGSVGNIFAISAIMIEDHLRKRGNIFIVNLILADLMMSVIVIPANALIILAGIEKKYTICHYQWFASILCCLVSVLTFSFIATENWLRIRHSIVHSMLYTTERILVMIALIWMVSISTVSLQFFLHLGPDFCTMDFTGALSFHITVGLLFIAVPAVVTCACYLKTILYLNDQESDVSFTFTMTLRRDYTTMKSNMCVFSLFIASWLPFGIFIGLGSVYNLPSRIYEYLSWLALSNSCFNSYVYGLTNRYFRDAYINLFHYCFCKTSVSFSRRGRSETSRGSDHVRVHIIPGYNMYSSTAGSGVSIGNSKVSRVAVKKDTMKVSSTQKRPTMVKSRPMMKGKDVYEL